MTRALAIGIIPPLSPPSASRSHRRGVWLSLAIASILVVAVLDWIALRRGWLGHPPVLLGGLVLLALILLSFKLMLTLLDLRKGRVSIPAGMAQFTTLMALSVVLAAGSANWLFGLQGYVILTEGETSLLRTDAQLQQFANGPLGRVDDLNVGLTLTSIELNPRNGASFDPVSELVVVDATGEHESVTVTTGRFASAGNLRFFQGVFGFAPRIVILREGDEVFDRTVPFFTDRSEGSATFFGEFSIADEDLDVSGLIDLGSLDERMRGHATLRLEVRKNGELLGSGPLLPGRFADLEQGYRVGFAGLDKWSEIVISRRNYESVMKCALVLLAIGATLWATVAWRGL